MGTLLYDLRSYCVRCLQLDLVIHGVFNFSLTALIHTHFQILWLLILVQKLRWGVSMWCQFLLELWFKHVNSCSWKDTEVQREAVSENSPGQKGPQKIICSNLLWKRDPRWNCLALCPVTSRKTLAIAIGLWNLDWVGKEKLRECGRLKGEVFVKYRDCSTLIEACGLLRSQCSSEFLQLSNTPKQKREKKIVFLLE